MNSQILVDVLHASSVGSVCSLDYCHPASLYFLTFDLFRTNTESHLSTPQAAPWVFDTMPLPSETPNRPTSTARSPNLFCAWLWLHRCEPVGSTWALCGHKAISSGRRHQDLWRDFDWEGERCSRQSGSMYGGRCLLSSAYSRRQPATCGSCRFARPSGYDIRCWTRAHRRLAAVRPQPPKELPT